jgi:hypothetical protein
MPRNANTFRRTLKRKVRLGHLRKCSRKRGCVLSRKKTRHFRQRGGKQGLADFLPTTSWGAWSNPPQATQFGPSASAPPALANGGMFSSPQSTGPWASTPFPPTQWARSLEAATGSAGAGVFAHQKPNDNFGASFSPAFIK